MNQQLTREQLNDVTTDLRLLRSNTNVKPSVFKITVNGKSWTVKDYANCLWIVRSSYGKLVVLHELWALQRLSGIKGIPANPYLIDDYALAYDYIEGDRFSRKREKITPECLENCEKLLEEFHSKGIVHLDTGSMNNWVLGDDGQPYLLDFQTAIPLSWVPKRLQNFAIAMDMRGVLKKWKALHPDDMGEDREERLEKVNQQRKKWFIH